MDTDIKEKLTPVELKIAEGLGITPETLAVAAKLGVSPQQLLGQQTVGQRRKQIDTQAKRSKSIEALREVRAHNSIIKLGDCEEEK